MMQKYTSVNIGSGIDLALFGAKPLPKPLLINH